MKEIEASLEEYRNVRKVVLDLALAVKKVEAQAEMEKIVPVLEKFQGRLSALAEYTSRQAEIVKDENIKDFKIKNRAIKIKDNSEKSLTETNTIYDEKEKNILKALKK